MSSPDPRFNQLAKEIVAFCQTHGYGESLEFILYELDLRCISKDVLGIMAGQYDPDMFPKEAKHQSNAIKAILNFKEDL